MIAAMTITLAVVAVAVGFLAGVYTGGRHHGQNAPHDQ